MKYKLLIALACMVWGTMGHAKKAWQDFDRQAFYAAMASNHLETVNNELAIVKASSVKEKDAYEGALLMKKAGLLKRPEEKLKAFKAGRMKFDPALQDDMDNTEYHFLRLTIQEHAPRIVKYYKEIDKDKEYIHKGYKNLSPVVQKAILDYSKTSAVLREEDL